MTFTPQLVALDVDGTLVTFDNELDPSVREAVRALHASGIPVVIATGRAVHGVMDALGKLGLASEPGLAVASNGSVVFNVSPLEIVHATTFDARDAVMGIAERLPDVLVAVEEIGVGYRVNRPFPPGEIGGQIAVGESIQELVEHPVTRVIVRAPDTERDEFNAMIDDLGLHDIQYYIGYTSWLDLAPEGISKASGLALVCDRLGIDAGDVLAVGDGNNDVEMLQWAGRGVAMGQAPDAVKAVADAVTGSISDHGLAEELRRYL